MQNNTKNSKKLCLVELTLSQKLISAVASSYLLNEGVTPDNYCLKQRKSSAASGFLSAKTASGQPSARIRSGASAKAGSGGSSAKRLERSVIGRASIN